MPEVNQQVNNVIPRDQKDRYKTLCQKFSEGKRGVCKQCKGSYFNLIKRKETTFPNLLYIELYCNKCELTHAIYTVESELVGGYP